MSAVQAETNPIVTYVEELIASNPDDFTVPPLYSYRIGEIFNKLCMRSAFKLANTIYDRYRGKVLFECSFGTLIWKACRHGLIDVAEYVYQLNPQGLSMGTAESIINHACHEGSLDVIKWIVSVFPGAANFKFIDQDCKNPEIIIPWLATNCLHLTPDKIRYDEKRHALSRACMFGSLDIAKIVMKVYPNRETDTSDQILPDSVSFYNSVCAGHIDIAEWLISLRPELYYMNTEMTFNDACMRGNHRAAEWLLNRVPELRERRPGMEAIAIACCNHGYIDSAMWLIATYPDMNVSVHNDYIFYHCCQHGKLNDAMALLAAYPTINIRAVEDRALINAIQLKNTEVASWLASLYANAQLEEVSQKAPDLYTIVQKSGKRANVDAVDDLPTKRANIDV